MSPLEKGMEMTTTSQRQAPVATARFAGRLGGNQAFIFDAEDDALERASVQPDAVSALDATLEKLDWLTFARLH